MRVFCGNINLNDLDKKVLVKGWVFHRRDHGGVIFIDLRDIKGLVQIVCNPDIADFPIAEKIRLEYVIQAEGLVRPRPDGTINPDIPSGEIEIICEKLLIINESINLPFQLEEENISENVRLTHRVLDLRRENMQKNLLTRNQISKSIRNYLDDNDFIEIETPMLTKSTPEGARDYLVPSRIHPGHFFALPQSPQLFKQMLMVSGFERYYQIVKCFRDEDLRADRQPEFTQIDIETSFLSASEILTLIEGMIRKVFKSILNIDLPNPFPQISYNEVINRFGSDKPDLRIDLELVDLTEEMKQVEFKVFREAANLAKGKVAALKVPEIGDNISRKEIDDLTSFVANYGAKGLAYIKINNLEQGIDGLQSPIVKFLGESALTIVNKVKGKNGDLIFFGADTQKIVNDSLGALRQKIGTNYGYLISGWQPLWVVDFPMFEYDDQLQKWSACHHPFTSPKINDLAEIATNPGKVHGNAYDLVINGWEIGGGSLRIYKKEIQKQVFNVLGIDEEEATRKFGFLLDALSLGAPPHGGIALGLDRLCAIITGADSIREVIAFPKTQRAQCLLTQSPNLASPQQLQELHIKSTIKN